MRSFPLFSVEAMERDEVCPVWWGRPPRLVNLATAGPPFPRLWAMAPPALVSPPLLFAAPSGPCSHRSACGPLSLLEPICCFPAEALDGSTAELVQAVGGRRQEALRVRAWDSGCPLLGEHGLQTAVCQRRASWDCVLLLRCLPHTPCPQVGTCLLWAEVSLE